MVNGIALHHQGARRRHPAVDTLESVLLYHVYAGGRVDFADREDPQRRSRSRPSLGRTIRHQVLPLAQQRWCSGTRTPNDVNPWVVNSKRNIDAGNSIVHGISLVLRPMDLPPLAPLPSSLSAGAGS